MREWLKDVEGLSALTEEGRLERWTRSRQRRTGKLGICAPGISGEAARGWLRFTSMLGRLL